MSDIDVRVRADTSQLQEASRQFNRLGGAIAEAGSEIPGFSAGLSALTGLFEGLTVASGGLIAVLGSLAAIVGVVAIALGGLGAAMAFNWVEKIGALNDVGDKLGITGNQAHYLQQAMEDAGLSTATLLTAQDRLAKAMMKTGDDTKGAGLAFDRLGVATEDAKGQLRGTEEVMTDLLGKIDIHNITTAQAADLSLVLGKNYREVVFAMGEAAKGQAVYTEMMEAGIGVSERSNELEDQMDMNHKRVSGTMTQMGSIMVDLVIPAWNSLTSWFVQSYKTGGAVAQVFNIIANTTNVLVEVVSLLVAGLGILVKAFVEVGRVGKEVFGGIFDAMSGNMSAGFDRIIHATDNTAARLQSYGKEAMALITARKDGLDQSFRDLFDGRDRVGEAQQAMLSKGGNLGSIIPRGASAGGKANDVKEKKEVDPDKGIDALIKQLTMQALQTAQLSKETIVLKELEDKRFAGADLQKKAKAVELAATIDQSNANKTLTEGTRALIKEATDYIKTIDDEHLLLGMNKRDITELMEIRKMDAATQATINKLRDDGIWTIERENKALAENEIQKLRVKDATAEAKKSDEDWLGNGIDKYVGGLKSMNESASDFVVTGLKGMQEGFTSLFSGSEFSWKSFVASILQGLAALIVQFTIITPIMESFKKSMAAMKGGSSMSDSGGFLGAAASFVGGLFGNQGLVFAEPHAQGGVLGGGAMTGWYGGQKVLGGEAGDEALLPLKRDAAGTLGVMVTGGKTSGGGGVTVQIGAGAIVVQGATNSEETAAAVEKRMVQIANNAAMNQIAKQSNSPGGRLYRGK